MNYEEAISYIHSRERLGSRPGLATVGELLCRLGNPQLRLNFVHIAGTNGKGSTAAYIASSLKAQGYKTGMYISPFVNDFNERIQIDGKNIEPEELARLTEIVSNSVDSTCEATEFEVVTAIGMLYFAEQRCERVVLEVGLGGRFDATNIIPSPMLAVITSISIDHTELLGDTVEKIAFEKCGIIKPGSTVVSYVDNPSAANSVISSAAKRTGCLWVLPDKDDIKILSSEICGTEFVYKGEHYKISMLGRHQVYNAVTAIEAARAMKISSEAIKSGLASVSFGGRLEVIGKNPFVIIDGAHNFSGVSALADAIKEYFPDKRVTVVMGMLKDKEYEKCVPVIARLACRFIAAEPDNPRKLPAARLAEIAARYNKNVSAFENRSDAIEAALKYADGPIIICGSLYLIGNINIKSCINSQNMIK